MLYIYIRPVILNGVFILFNLHERKLNLDKFENVNSLILWKRITYLRGYNLSMSGNVKRNVMHNNIIVETSQIMKLLLTFDYLPRRTF